MPCSPWLTRAYAPILTIGYQDHINDTCEMTSSLRQALALLSQQTHKSYLLWGHPVIFATNHLVMVN